MVSREDNGGEVWRGGGVLSLLGEGGLEGFEVGGGECGVWVGKE